MQSKIMCILRVHLFSLFFPCYNEYLSIESPFNKCTTVINQARKLARIQGKFLHLSGFQTAKKGPKVLLENQ